MKAEGAAGPSSTTETKEAEGELLMDRALPNTSDTTPDTAGGSLSSVETWEEEEGSSLLEDVTAPENSTEPSALRGAGDSADMAPPPKKVRILLGAGEQLWPVALCVALWSGCIPHIPLATLGSCCLAPCRRSSLFADAVLCCACRAAGSLKLHK